MAQYNSENILVGAAAIFVSSDDTAVVTADGNTATALNTDPLWQSTGYTTGGVEVTYTPDYGAVEVDQLLDDAVLFKQRMTVSVATTLAEATLDNLIFAWGQADSTITPTGSLDGEKPTATRTLTLESGNLGDRPIERQLAFVGQAPVGADERVYHLHRCLNVESSAHSLSRADATSIPVSLRCLPNNDGEYGTITDFVAPVVP